MISFGIAFSHLNTTKRYYPAVTLKYKHTTIRANFGEFGRRFKFPPPPPLSLPLSPQLSIISQRDSTSLSSLSLSPCYSFSSLPHEQKTPSNMISSYSIEDSKHSNNNNNNNLKLTSNTISSNLKDNTLKCGERSKNVIFAVAETCPQQRLIELKKAQRNEKYNRKHSPFYKFPDEVLMVTLIHIHTHFLQLIQLFL